MERRGLLVPLCFCVVFQLLLSSASTISLRSIGEHGSRQTLRTCECQSVELWIRRRTAPNSKLASYEDVTRSKNRSLAFATPLERRLRLWPQESCKLLLHGERASKENTSFHYEITSDGLAEVWLNDGSNCVSFWMKCKRKSLCVGIDLHANVTDFVQLKRRKLLMVTPGRDDKYSHYGVALSVIVLCAMVVLIALCGSTSKKSPLQVIYTGEGEVQVISAEKVQSIPRKEHSESGIESKEISERSGDHIVVVVTDDNSNNSPKPALDNDPGHVEAVSNDLVRNEQDRTDGQVCGKQSVPEKEIERDKENKKGKGQVGEKESKAMQRANTSPPGKTETKGLLVGRLSLKSHPASSTTHEDKKSVKKDKKRSKKKSESHEDPHEFHEDPQDHMTAGKSNFKSNRRSFVGRELPAVPKPEMKKVPLAADDNYAEPYDRDEHRPVTQRDLDEDSNYETVQNRVKSSIIMSAKDEIVKSYRNSSSATAPGRPLSVKGDGDEVFYDSVDEKRTRNAGSLNSGRVQSKFADFDTYEDVPESTKRTLSEPSPKADIYEVVVNGNTSGVYEEPNIKRQRSASDVVKSPSISRVEAERKALSLQRGQVLRPDPPPIDNLNKIIRQASRESNESEEVIDPYTITTKKGDYIVQETSIPQLPLPKPEPYIPVLSPEEKENLYSKVDKEKQKRDREIMGKESQATREKERKESVDCTPNKTCIQGELPDAIHGDDDDDDDEHDYEHVHNNLTKGPGTA